MKLLREKLCLFTADMKNFVLPKKKKKTPLQLSKRIPLIIAIHNK